MMKPLRFLPVRLLPLLLVVILITGCLPSQLALAESIETVCRPLSPPSPTFDQASVITNDSVCMSSCPKPAPNLDSVYACFHCLQQAFPETPAKARDFVQEEIVKLSNQVCTVFTARLVQDLIAWAKNDSPASRAVVPLVFTTEKELIDKSTSKNIFNDSAQKRLPSLPDSIDEAITGAMRRRQNQINLLIAAEKKNGGIDYPLEAVVREALFYEGRCSALAFFSELSGALRATCSDLNCFTPNLTPAAATCREELKKTIDMKEKTQ